MGPETKSAALEKLSKMKNRIGFSDRLLNETYLDELLNGILLEPTKFYDNMRAIDHAEMENELKKLREPYDPSDDDFPPALVNAAYSAQNNEIMFPAAILQVKKLFESFFLSKIFFIVLFSFQCTICIRQCTSTTVNFPIRDSMK